MKEYYLFFGVLGVMVVAAAIIEWTNSNRSFSFSDGLASDGSVSFNYPENMEKHGKQHQLPVDHDRH
ncbi:MAG: hypothetical protein ABFC12_04440 [Methanobacterium sp.]